MHCLLFLTDQCIPSLLCFWTDPFERMAVIGPNVYKRLCSPLSSSLELKPFSYAVQGLCVFSLQVTFSIQDFLPISFPIYFTSWWIGLSLMTRESHTIWNVRNSTTSHPWFSIFLYFSQYRHLDYMLLFGIHLVFQLEYLTLPNIYTSSVINTQLIFTVYHHTSHRTSQFINTYKFTTFLPMCHMEICICHSYPLVEYCLLNIVNIVQLYLKLHYARIRPAPYYLLLLLHNEIFI